MKRNECDRCRKGEHTIAWNTVRERALAKVLLLNVGNAKYPCFCRRRNLPILIIKIIILIIIIITYFM